MKKNNLVEIYVNNKLYTIVDSFYKDSVIMYLTDGFSLDFDIEQIGSEIKLNITKDVWNGRSITIRSR